MALGETREERPKPEHGSMEERRQARAAVHGWIGRELLHYADTKWDRSDPNHTTFDREVYEGLWRPQIEEKLHRAGVLGVETPLGMQALLKALVTCFEACVTMYVASDGDVPVAGVPSGEIVSKG